MQNASSVLFALLIVALTSGAIAMTERSPELTPSDAAITASIKNTLEADPEPLFVKIEVDTNRGVVWLRGFVESAKQRQQAEQTAWRVKGVKTVINELAILAMDLANTYPSPLA